MKNGIINLSRDFWKESFTSSTSAAAAIAGNVQVKPKLSKSTTKCPTKAIMIKLSCKDFASVNLSTEEVAANSGCVAISTRLWDSCNDHLNKSSMCVHCTLCNGSGRYWRNLLFGGNPYDRLDATLAPREVAHIVHLQTILLVINATSSVSS